MRTTLLKAGFILMLSALSTTQTFAFTAVTSGDWTDPATWGGTAPTGTVNGDNIVIPTGITVNLNTNVTFSGLLNNFTVDGTLNSSGTSWLEIQSGTFTGSGDIDIQRIEFSGLLTTYSFSGDMMVNTFANSGAILGITAQVEVSDSLYLEDGSFTLNTGGNLLVAADSKIVRDAGSLATSGGIFNAGGSYHVHYIGGSKTTGIEINSPSMQDAVINLDDNSEVVTLGSDLMINGNLQLNTGILSVAANDLEIHGDLSIQSGASLTTTAASNLMIETGSNLSSGLVFTSGSSVGQLMVDYTGSGSVMLNSSLDIAGELHLHDGTLSIESGSVLTMNAGSVIQVMDGELQGNGGTFTGTASYDVEYLADSSITTGIEITGTGLNDVEVNLGEGQLMLEDDLIVDGELELVSGILDLNANNLEVNGSFVQTVLTPIKGNVDSDLHLNITTLGNDTIYFDGASADLAQFIVDVTGGDLVLGSELHINDELTMTSGSIILMNDDLIIEENADITGYSNTRYIMTPNQGMLQMHVALSAPYTVFPVGSPSSYSPASIQQGSGAAAGNFMVRAFNGVFTGGTEGSGFNSATNGSVVNRTWLIESDASTLDVSLKLGWTATAEVNGFDRTSAYISHYMNSDWDTQTASNATAGANSTFELTRTGLTSLSPFAVADEDAELTVDENELLTIEVYPNPATDVMNISYADNGNEYVFEITDLSGRNYDIAANGNQMDVSGLSQGTYLLKMTNASTNKVSVKQFIKK